MEKVIGKLVMPNLGSFIFFLPETGMNKPTDYGVGDIDGRGSMLGLALKEKYDTSRSQSVKGYNGRSPVSIPWKWIAAAFVAYYFFSKS